MPLSRRILAVHRLIVVGTALRLVGGLDTPAVHANDDPPLAPAASPAPKSPTSVTPKVPASPVPSTTPHGAPVPLTSDIYIDVQMPTVVSSAALSEDDLGKETAFALHKSLAKCAADQHIANPTDSSVAAPKALHLTLAGEVGVVEVGDIGHRPCTLTLRLYLDEKEGKKRHLVAQMSGVTLSRRELTSGDIYKNKPLVAVMAPKILDAAMNAALEEMIDALAPSSEDAAEETPSQKPPLVAALPLKVSLDRLDREPDSAIVQRIDSNHGLATSAGTGEMVVAPGRSYHVILTPTEGGMLYLIKRNRETMLPTFVDSPIFAAPKQAVVLPLPTEGSFTAPDAREGESQQLYVAFLQKRHEIALAPASNPSASATGAASPPSPATSKKRQNAKVPPDENQILISASVPLYDTFDPAIAQLVHLYRTHPEDLTAIRIAVTTVPTTDAASPDNPSVTHQATHSSTQPATHSGAPPALSPTAPVSPVAPK